jgi:hypothetical protein
MQDSWLRQKAEEIQKYADTHDMKRFYDAIKEVYGPQSSASSPVYNADETSLLTEKSQILHRWAEHFETVLNRPSQIYNDAINRPPQVSTNQDLDQTPTMAEVDLAIKQMSKGKAPGTDEIPAEIYKHAGPNLRAKLLDLFLILWQQGRVSQRVSSTRGKETVTCVITTEAYHSCA